jgi:hypothetical protein
MSALGIVHGVEGLMNTLAMGVAANGLNQQGYAGDTPRTINAVHKLIDLLHTTEAELQKERAARAALQDQVDVLRYALENAAAQIMRMQVGN